MGKKGASLRYSKGFIVLLLLPLLAIAGIFIFFKNFFDGEDRLANEKNIEKMSAPTSFPFQEMTIPYLRSREYTSEIGEMEFLRETASYTSYLTSYTSDGLRINGLLTVPKGDTPASGWPAIVFVHGYIPPSTYETTGNYGDYVDYLAGNGFVVFKIDLRGHGQSEGEAGGGYFSSDYIIDTLNASAALASSDFVNSEAIGFWGHSMAGNVLLRAMAVRPEIPAIVIWAGAVYTYSDMQEYGIDDNSYVRPPEDSEREEKRDTLFDTYGRFDSESNFWRQVAATNYLGDIKGAIQIDHSVNDEVVNIGYSRNLANLLEEAGVEYELNEYTGGGHNINGGYFPDAMEDTVEFFNTHFP